MIPYTYSLHHIQDARSFGFDPDDYSRFKFGDDQVARLSAKPWQMVSSETFWQTTWIGEQIVVISSPYCFIPTATFAMKNYFVYQPEPLAGGKQPYGDPGSQSAPYHHL